MSNKSNVNTDIGVPRAHKGWTQSALTDIVGVSMLNEWLCRDPKHRFFPDIRHSDTIPAYDGTISFGMRDGDSRIAPVGIVEVQVKSVLHTPWNNNKTKNKSDFKYDCDAAVFHAADQRVSKNPSMLVIADTESGKCYRIHLTRDYVDSLKLDEGTKRRVVYFNEEDALQDYGKFYSELLRRASVSAGEFDRALNHALMCPDDISQDRLKELQKQANRVNYLCDGELSFLRYSSPKDIWKICLLYREEKERYWLALAAMEYGNGEHIELRSLATGHDTPRLKSMPLAPGINGDAHLATVLPAGEPLSKAVDELLTLWCRKFTETWFIPPKAMTDEVIGELAFRYLDQLASWVPALAATDKPGRFYRDAITAEQFKRCVEAVPYAFDCYYRDLPEQLLEDAEVTVFLCELPKKGEEVPGWLTGRIEEFITGDMPYQEGLHLQIKCEVIPFQYMLAIASEAYDRKMTVERAWVISPRAEIQRKIANKPRMLEPFRRHPYDFGLTKPDMEANFARFIERVGPACEKAARVFFELDVIKRVPRHSHECTLYDDGFYAEYRSVVAESDTERWHLEAIHPIDESVEHPKEVVDQLVAEYGSVNLTCLPVPQFIGELPLYSAVESFLLEGVKALLGDEAIEPWSFPEERQRERVMGYTVSRRGFSSGQQNE